MLYEWRKVPRSDGYSPAQLGRAQRTSLPTLPSQNVPINFNTAASSKDTAHARTMLDHDRSKLSLTSLSPGQEVYLQDFKSLAWDKRGVIISMQPCRQPVLYVSTPPLETNFFRHTLSRRIGNSQFFSSFILCYTLPFSTPSVPCSIRSSADIDFSSSFNMAPLLLSYGQSIIDEVHKQQLVEKYIRQHGYPSGASTEAPTIHAEDKAEVSLDTEVTDSSSEISLDQSNNGFSLVNLHWASFSTGLSSVLAVVLAGLLIAGCCYFRGRRQRQTRSRHTELLHALSSTDQSCQLPRSFPIWRLSPSVDAGPVNYPCLLYTSPSPRDRQKARMPSSA